jgi:hypothetical protein
MTEKFTPPPFPAAPLTPEQTTPTPAPSNRRHWIAGITLGVTLVGGLGWWAATHTADPLGALASQAVAGSSVGVAGQMEPVAMGTDLDACATLADQAEALMAAYASKGQTLMDLSELIIDAYGSLSASELDEMSDLLEDDTQVMEDTTPKVANLTGNIEECRRLATAD